MQTKRQKRLFLKKLTENKVGKNGTMFCASKIKLGSYVRHKKN